jgi:hypothetical protein
VYGGDAQGLSFATRKFDIIDGGGNSALDTSTKELTYITLTASRFTNSRSGFESKLPAAVIQGTIFDGAAGTGHAPWNYFDDTALVARFCRMKLNEPGHKNHHDSTAVYVTDSFYLVATGNITITTSAAGTSYPVSTSAGGIVSFDGNDGPYSTWAPARLTRRSWNHLKPQVWEYSIYKALFIMDSSANGTSDGVFEDESNWFHTPRCYWAMKGYPFSGQDAFSGAPMYSFRGWEGLNPATGQHYTQKQIRDSLHNLREKLFVIPLAAKFNAMGRLYLPNPASYGHWYDPVDSIYPPNCGSSQTGEAFYPNQNDESVEDVRLGIGAWYGEWMKYSMSGMASGFGSIMWRILDSLGEPEFQGTGKKAVMWYYVNPLDLDNYGGASAAARAVHFALVHYYLAANPNNCYFMCAQNLSTHHGTNAFYGTATSTFRWGAMSDTITSWVPSMEGDIGTPTAFRISHGNGVWSRPYTKGKVVLAQTASGTQKLYLGGTYYQLYPNGTFGPAADTATLNGPEGQIFKTTNVLTDTSSFLPDTIPPGTINDLGVLPGSQHGDAILAWTAPGDDGSSGTATSYQIRYALWPLTLANWTSASIVANPPSPAIGGTQQSDTVSGLIPGGKYYFGIKATDDAANSSTGYSPPGFAAGIATPAPMLTQVDSSTGSVTVTVTTVPSYLTLSYEFAIDTVSHFSNPTTKTTSNLGAATETSVDFQNLNETVNYFWKCRAVSASPVDSSYWSNSIQFNLQVNVIRPLVDSDLVVPAINQAFTSLRPIFEVASVPNVTHVYFQVDSNVLFVSPISSGAVVTTADSATHWQVSDILTEGTSWFARASSDNVIWTSPVPFSVAGGATALEPHPYPNPYRPESGNLTFVNIPTGSDLVILTMSGDVVRKFWDIATPQATWDGRNESGNAVSSGVYLWQLDPAKKSGKIIVVR